jgi:hypothetical protein
MRMTRYPLCEFPRGERRQKAISLGTVDHGYVVVEAFTDAWRELISLMIGREDNSNNKLADCVSRGVQIDSIPCRACGGKVMLKVFACAIHQRCCIGKTVDGVKSCAGCGDYKSTY